MGTAGLLVLGIVHQPSSGLHRRWGAGVGRAPGNAEVLVKINVLHRNMLVFVVLFKKRKKGILTLSFNIKLLAILILLSA